jgi:predicted permease
MRYALRQMRKSPGFGVTVVVVLALGIGANIAVFTLVNGILLRPLPYAQADRLVTVRLQSDQPYFGLNMANMLQLRDAAGSRVAAGMIEENSAVSVVGPGGRIQVTRADLTAGLFEVLGVPPMLGRTFRAEENEPGHTRVVVIAEQVWRKLYNGDPHILGKTLVMRGAAYTIVGVMPGSFSFPFDETMQIWTPMELDAVSKTAMSGDHQAWGEMYARLPEGMTAAQLAADLSRTQAVIAREVGNDLPTRVDVFGYQESLNRHVRKPLLLLYAVVFGIWALACMNVTSLIMTRAVARGREQAVRAALGATRSRLMQQAIVESVLLSGMGAAAGLLLGQTTLKLLWQHIEQKLPMTKAVYLDFRVIGCLAVLTLITAAVAGIFPALRAMRAGVRDELHGVTSTASARQNRTREVLVVAQLALTLVFLVGAGLFLRTIHALRQVPLGFSEQNVLTGGVILNGGSHQLEEQALSNQEVNVVRTSYLPLLERMRAIPGVRVAALSSVLPMRSEFSVMVSGTLDGKDAPKGKGYTAQGRLVSSGLVEALGMPMLRGRFFSDDDTISSPVVVVVNQAFANKYLPGRDAIGHIFGMGKGRYESPGIVGVIGDMKQEDLTKATTPEVYFCLAQMEPGTPLYGIATAFIQVAIRGRIPADMLRAQFDKALHEVAPDATTTNVKTMHEAVEDSFGSQTLIAQLLETFAALALMIASVGLYGLLSFVVARRTREIGVRLALGASQQSILRLVLHRALLLVSLGMAGGGVLAWFTTTLARGYIYGIQAHDGLTFLAVMLVLGAAAFTAAWLPARRAASVDPILALRSE